jgi:hypothetical protein
LDASSPTAAYWANAAIGSAAPISNRSPVARIGFASVLSVIQPATGPQAPQRGDAGCARAAQLRVAARDGRAVEHGDERARRHQHPHGGRQGVADGLDGPRPGERQDGERYAQRRHGAERLPGLEHAAQPRREHRQRDREREQPERQHRLASQRGRHVQPPLGERGGGEGEAERAGEAHAEHEPAGGPRHVGRVALVGAADARRERLGEGAADPEVERAERPDERPRERQEPEPLRAHRPHEGRDGEQGEHRRHGPPRRAEPHVAREQPPARELRRGA